MSGYQPSLRPIAERVRARRAVLDDAAQELVAVCRALGDVRAVYAFGSYGREAIGPHSDLDVLIVRDTTLPRFQREDDIRRRFRAPVGLDLIVVRPEEFAQLDRSPFGRTILRDARRLDAS